MPIYEYRCKKCGLIFELRRPYGESNASTTCISCGGACEKLVSGFGSQMGHYVRAAKKPFRGAGARDIGADS